MLVFKAVLVGVRVLVELEVAVTVEVLVKVADKTGLLVLVGVEVLEVLELFELDEVGELLLPQARGKTSAGNDKTIHKINRVLFFMKENSNGSEIERPSHC